MVVVPVMTVKDHSRFNPEDIIPGGVFLEESWVRCIRVVEVNGTYFTTIDLTRDGAAALSGAPKGSELREENDTLRQEREDAWARVRAHKETILDLEGEISALREELETAKNFTAKVALASDGRYRSLRDQQMIQLNTQTPQFDRDMLERWISDFDKNRFNLPVINDSLTVGFDGSAS